MNLNELSGGDLGKVVQTLQSGKLASGRIEDLEARTHSRLNGNPGCYSRQSKRMGRGLSLSGFMGSASIVALSDVWNSPSSGLVIVTK